MSKVKKCKEGWTRTIMINGVSTKLIGSRIILETLPYRLNTIKDASGRKHE